MKTAGVIGGLGPNTTAEFYLELIKRARPVYPYSYPDIFIHSVPVPFSVEKDMVQNGHGEEAMFRILKDAVQKLENAGADFIVIPCNTVHIFYEQLRSLLNIPLLNILNETAMVCRSRGWKKVGTLGTKMTIQSRIYSRALEDAGIIPVELAGDTRERLSLIIYRILSGDTSSKQREEILGMMSMLRDQGADGVILGCTDLQLLIQENDTDLPVPVIDSMSCLVDAVIRELAE